MMLRPIDLIEFSVFAGTNADDILIWVGKSLGKSVLEKFFYQKDWSKESMETKKEVLLGILEALELMGYGRVTGAFKKDHILVEVEDSLSADEKDNIMAKNLCLLNQGILAGIIDALQIDVENEEIKCVLVGYKTCVFKFTLIGEVFEDRLVDEDSEETVSDFLSTL